MSAAEARDERILPHPGSRLIGIGHGPVASLEIGPRPVVRLMKLPPRPKDVYLRSRRMRSFGRFESAFFREQRTAVEASKREGKAGIATLRGGPQAHGGTRPGKMIPDPTFNVQDNTSRVEVSVLYRIFAQREDSAVPAGGQERAY